MRLAVALTLLAGPLAHPVAAQDFDGLYYWTGTDPVQGCEGLGSTETTIEITEGSIWFVESGCELTNPTAVENMPEGTLYDAVCYGEGETWTEGMFIYKTFEGIAVLSGGAARTYTACQ